MIWKRDIGAAHQGSYGGSRSTPTFDNGQLFCLSSAAQLHCLDSKTGNPHWKRDLAKDYDAKIMQAMGKIDWKFAESPLVDGDRVIVTPGSSQATIVAFNRKSGNEIWKCVIPELGDSGRDGAAYSSAIVSEACEIRQYVQLVGRGLISVEAETGKFLWGYNRVANDVANISSPLATGDLVFSSTGYNTGSALVKVNQSGGDVNADELYFLRAKQFQNHHGGFVLKNDYIYGGHGHKMGLPICVRLSDGNVMWGPVRNRGKASAACILADGHVYFRYQDGLVVLVEATPTEYREKGSFMIPDVKRESWSHPVISNGRLFLKEQGRILCFDIKDHKASVTRS